MSSNSNNKPKTDHDHHDDHHDASTSPGVTNPPKNDHVSMDSKNDDVAVDDVDDNNNNNVVVVHDDDDDDDDDDDTIPEDIRQEIARREKETNKKWRYRKSQRDMPSIQYMLVHGAPEAVGRKQSWFQILLGPLALLVIFTASLHIFLRVLPHLSKRKTFTLPQLKNNGGSAAWKGNNWHQHHHHQQQQQQQYRQPPLVVDQVPDL